MRILANKDTNEILGYAKVGGLTATEDNQVVFNSDVQPEPRSNYTLSLVDGKWVVVEKSDDDKTALVDSIKARSIRFARDTELTATDYIVVKSLETSVSVPTDWMTYRQALRDIPEHTNWPDLSESDWPIKPE